MLIDRTIAQWIAWLSLMFAGAAAAVAPPQGSSLPVATIRVSVLLVDDQLNVKPAPRHVLTLTADAVVREPVRLVTGFDGKAEAVVPAGAYTLQSDRAVDFQGKSYRWRQSIILKAGETKSIELSIDNATISGNGATAPATDLPSLFKQWQGSVVTVWSEAGHGSGFVIDSRGFIATNQHVIGLSDYAAVQFSDTLKVPAVVAARSTEKDVAILRVNPKYVTDTVPVQLGYSETGTPPALEGQQVFTIGSPLHQRKVMTTGIVGKVEPKAIISDININHGNSGGPLFTLDGRVIGITTFGDFSAQGGPGISGIVRIDEARSVVTEAEGGGVEPPSEAITLPVEPSVAFPLEGLKDTLQSAPVKPDDYSMSIGDFDVTFITPILTYGSKYALEQSALAEKTKRDKKAGAASSTVDPFAEYQNWAEYLGEFQAVLIIDARPKLTEGFWSGLNRGLAQSRGLYGGPAQLHFKTDFSRMTLHCGGSVAVPIEPGKVEHRASANNAAVKVNDVTYEGFYSFAPDAISPYCGTVTIEVFSEKDSTVPQTKVLPPKLVQKLWDDFAPYRLAIHSGR